MKYLDPLRWKWKMDWSKKTGPGSHLQTWGRSWLHSPFTSFSDFLYKFWNKVSKYHALVPTFVSSKTLPYHQVWFKIFFKLGKNYRKLLFSILLSVFLHLSVHKYRKRGLFDDQYDIFEEISNWTTHSLIIFWIFLKQDVTSYLCCVLKHMESKKQSWLHRCSKSVAVMTKLYKNLWVENMQRKYFKPTMVYSNFTTCKKFIACFEVVINLWGYKMSLSTITIEYLSVCVNICTVCKNGSGRFYDLS